MEDTKMALAAVHASQHTTPSRFLWTEMNPASRLRSLAGPTDKLLEPKILQPAEKVTTVHHRPGGRIENRPGIGARHSVPHSKPAVADSFALAVQYFFAVTNDAVLEGAISLELKRQWPQLKDFMSRHVGGLFAVAYIMVAWDPAQAFGPMRSQDIPPGGLGKRSPLDVGAKPPDLYFGPEFRRLNSLWIDRVVYPNPETAYAKYSSTPSLTAAPGTAEYQERRYFWGAYI
jgi:hypothetical protein